MSSLDRDENLGRLRGGGTWDVVVIGGGATGLGAAVDAAARGYRTALLEARDFAQGTSSRSTKLIHGGVRYLAQGDIPLVREALHERGVLFRNAPHLVHRRDFVVPAYRWRDLPFYGIGLKVYDLLAGRSNLGGSRWIGPAEVARRIPTIVGRGLRGGIVYTDGQFDDARLAIALARTFADLGGTAHRPRAGRRLLARGGRIAAVALRDDETGEELAIEAKVVVNATGVYADAVRRLDDPGTAGSPLLTPSRGTHIVLDRSFLPGESALARPAYRRRPRAVHDPLARPGPGRDDRHPRRRAGRRAAPGPRGDRLPAPPRRPLPGEEAAGRRCAEHVRRPEAAVAAAMTCARATSGAPTAKLSREHAVVVSPSGLVTITGGKWTTYRRMGADAVDRAVEVGGLPPRPSTTVSLRLHGWRESADGRDDPLSVYGSDAAGIRALGGENPGWDRPLHPALPYRAAEVVWAARHEAARSVEDVLARRTRALFLDARASIEAAPVVAALLAAVLGKDPAWQEAEVGRFRELADGYLAPEVRCRRVLSDAPGIAGPSGPVRTITSRRFGIRFASISHIGRPIRSRPGCETGIPDDR